MSEKDEKLIQQGFKCTEWYDASKLEDQAESAEAKEILHSITMKLYHADEWFAGTL